MPWHREIEELAKEYIVTVVKVSHLDMYIADGWVELRRFHERGVDKAEIRKRFSS